MSLKIEDHLRGIIQQQKRSSIKGIHESRSSYRSLSSIKAPNFWESLLMGELTLTSKSSNWRYAVVVMMMSTCTCKKLLLLLFPIFTKQIFCSKTPPKRRFYIVKSARKLQWLSENDSKVIRMRFWA